MKHGDHKHGVATGSNSITVHHPSEVHTVITNPALILYFKKDTMMLELVSTRPTQMGLETEDKGRQLEKQLQVVTCTERKRRKGFISLEEESSCTMSFSRDSHREQQPEAEYGELG